ncbi:MAG: spore germination protein [Clostridiales bacterium]|jgi:spore germination protein|nr:spore germination protein [Clostridiales bacterium]
MKPISPDLSANAGYLENLFAGCGDIVSRTFTLAGDGARVYVVYADMLVSRQVVDEQLVRPLLLNKNLSAAERGDYLNIFDFLAATSVVTADMKPAGTLEEIEDAVLAGDCGVLIDGCERGIVVSAKGFPNRGVGKSENEPVIYGSKEAFCEVIRVNTTLIRRRIRDPRLKIKQLQIGARSKTDAAVIYLSDVARPEILSEVTRRLDKILGARPDAVPDSGFIAQLMEDSWKSPFPQVQATERPDKAAAAILEGRVVIVVDNSPQVVVAPVTLSCFFQSSEDYYERFHIMSFLRLLRHAAAVLAVCLPAFYISAVYNPSGVSSLLLFKMAAARAHVPMPALAEMFFMDLAFELIREACVRLPGAAGGTIGIVGGIIVGQAAVEAGLVSPVTVIIVALVGIASFAVPQTSLVSALRLVKYVLMAFAGVLGLAGFYLGCAAVLAHLAALSSFGVPYFFPAVSADLSDGNDAADSVFRLPFFMMKRRPIFAAPMARRRMR